MSHGEAYFTEGALVKPIDKLTRSDFFPDIIGMKQHFAFGTFCMITGARVTRDGGAAFPSGNSISGLEEVLRLSDKSAILRQFSAIFAPS